MISLLSLGAASKRHFLIASNAEPTSSGLPPTTFVLVTRPSGEIVASILTLPVTFICFARAGKSGTTLVLTLRLAVSAGVFCAKAFGTRSADVDKTRARTKALEQTLSFTLTPYPGQTKPQ